MNTLLLRLVPAVVLLLAPLAAQAQSDTDLVLRLNRAEEQVRQLTGTVEQLQWRNQQLEQQLRAVGGAPQAQVQPQVQQQVQPQSQQQIAAPQIQQQPQVARSDTTTGRRSDVFDPSQNPNAPGVPRALGGTAPVIAAAPQAQQAPQMSPQDEPDIGAPGGRAPGEPLDLSRMGANNPAMATIQNPSGNPQQPPLQQQPSQQPQQQPMAPQRAPAGVVATLPPSQTPKDEFDLGYGYVLRKDYALAEDTLRGFLQKHASDALAPEAQYWLGESQFQRQRYRDAAESFLKVTTSYGNAPNKGAEALLRLGQSLAMLNEREAACAALGEVTRKYPKASAGVRQGVDREQKRVRC